MKNAAERKSDHVIVISVDALNALDYELMQELPHFRQILREGSHARQVQGIYPSLTYPAHTSIVTGCYPIKHGITANAPPQPERLEPKWYWYTSDVKVPTLYEKAAAAGMKVGAMLWPVMAGAKVAYNCPEIWPVENNQSQFMLSMKTGTPLFLLDIFLRFRKHRKGKQQPYLDNFITLSAAHMVKSRKPDLALIHLIELDHERHVHGLRSPEAYAALRRQDRRIGQIMTAAKEAGIYDKTTFVVLGDHGFAVYHHKISLNALFAREGLLSVNSQGHITDWKAYANSCDGSAQVFISHPHDNQLRERVLHVLQEFARSSSSGIEAIYLVESAASKGLGGDFEFMIEAKEGYSFTNYTQGDTVVSVEQLLRKGIKIHVGSHGYDPEKPGYKTFFAAAGAGIKKGVVLDHINLVDEGPTMARLLGLTLPDADGRVISEILM